MYSFYKYHGLGNDFIIFDCLSNLSKLISDLNDPDLLKRICNRNFGVGADGVIFILPPRVKGDVYMRIINSDSSEAEMCGNGIRCLVRYLFDNNKINLNEDIVVETLAGNIKAKISNDQLISVDMGSPNFDPNIIPTTLEVGKYGIAEGTFNISNFKLKGYSVSMGNPHLIIPVSNLEDVDLTDWGKILENNNLFPNKTNVHFMQVENKSLIKVLVWERGAGPTLACGTGACACLVTANIIGLSNSKATIKLPGGELLIEWKKENNSIIMNGPAEFIYKATLAEEYLSNIKKFIIS